MKPLSLLTALLACCVMLSSCMQRPTEPVADDKPLEDTAEVAAEKPPAQPMAELTPSVPVFRSSAYLPVTALPEDISAFAEEYSASLDSLDYLILNTGVYWNDSGELEISDSLIGAIDTLGEIPLWCTVNPKGSLIREEKAGQTIATEEERKALAERIAAFAKENRLSGIDIDWEFPMPEEWSDFSDFVVDLSEALENISSEISLSLALYPQDIYLTEQAVEAIDLVNVMAYDQFDRNGFHSTMQTAEDAVDYFLSLGFEPRQLTLGIPAYGRPLDGSAKWIFYKDIDLNAVSADEPNLVGDVYFNSPSLASNKTSLAKEKGLSGVMLYHLLCDRTDENSIVNAIK